MFVSRDLRLVIFFDNENWLMRTGGESNVRIHSLWGRGKHAEATRTRRDLLNIPAVQAVLGGLREARMNRRERQSLFAASADGHDYTQSMRAGIDSK